MKFTKSILICGAGSIGKRHTGNFSKLFAYVDIVDINPDRVKEATSKYKIRNHYLSVSEALSGQKYDAVVIATPPHVHKEIAIEVIKNKLNLFIEKPLGMDADGWQNLHDNCQKHKLISYVGYSHRFVPYTVKLKELMQKKIIGDVVHANMRWGSYLPDWHPWEDYRHFYMSKKEQGGGALMDESHGIDLVRYIIGEIDKVGAIIDNISDLEMTSDDAAFLTFKMKNGSLIQINFDLSSRAPRVNFEIVGKEGTIIWDRVEHNLKVFTIKTKKWEVIQFSKEDYLSMYTIQAKHFYDCIYGNHKPLIDIKDAIQTQKVIDAAFKSSKTEKLVKID
jgi:predicted dehydrogenase|tara:strand:+ start:2561 stop:3565 length:1005 start_codon:yes stop_codon:yes gene_type:complete